jgi:hypothetical protein
MTAGQQVQDDWKQNGDIAMNMDPLYIGEFQVVVMAGNSWIFEV